MLFSGRGHLFHYPEGATIGADYPATGVGHSAGLNGRTAPWAAAAATGDELRFLPADVRIKCRRNRTVYTEHHLTCLEKQFDRQKYLSTKDRQQLANQLGLSQIQVKTWYQNRRMKWKKQVHMTLKYLPSTIILTCIRISKYIYINIYIYIYIYLFIYIYTQLQNVYGSS